MNDLELIRTFRSDVEPPDDRRVATARARLMAEYQEVPAARRWRLHRRPAFAALLTVPALAAVAALLIVGAFAGNGGGTADAAIIRHAHVALSGPANEILHSKVEGDGFMAESWQLTSPPYSFVLVKGRVGAANPEQAGNGSTASYYDPASNAINEQSSAGPQPAVGDPLTAVRQDLQTGQARVLGTAQIGGVSTYKIQFADKGGFDSQSVIAYVNQHTYRPVMLADPQRDGTIVHLRVVTLEYLPATPANLQLLSLTKRHPGARVVTGGPGKPAPVRK